MDKNFLLILFYSASGSVKNLAHAIADGATVGDATVDVAMVDNTFVLHVLCMSALLPHAQVFLPFPS